MLKGSWHGSVIMAFMFCWIHDWFMTGWWLVVQDLWHVEESMAWIRKLWHNNCGMLKGSWHGAAIMAWRRYFMRKQTVHGMLSLSWPIKVAQKDFSITFVPAAVSAKPVRLTCLFAWAGQPGSYDFHRSMACSMVFASECFVVSTHVLVHSLCRAQHWMSMRIMALCQSICCMDLHGIS